MAEAGQPPTREAETAITELRSEIDRLDRRILELLNERARRALDIGEVKRRSGLAVYDPGRETALLNALIEENGGPLPEDAVRMIYRRIVQACRNLESPPKVAFLGPKGTFSHQAAIAYFGPGVDAAPVVDLPDAAEAVARGEAEFALLPVENSIEGIVGTTYDLVAEHGLSIQGELVLPVHLYLVGEAPALEDIDTVYSHPQPLRQARRWLRERLPGARQVPVASTADAADRVANQSGAAAIVSPLLADREDLVRLAGPVEDRPDNRTRFWVVGREPALEGAKTSLMLTLPHRPGSLSAVLRVFAARGINLTSIASRPAPSQPWEYRFFIDIEGSLDPTEGGETTVEALEREGAHVRVLGTYDATAADAP